MILKQSIQQVFVQISQTLNELSNDEYSNRVRFAECNYGEHVRHIIELFQCLEKGYETVSLTMKKENGIMNLRIIKNWLLHC
jgi:hypothetical protein